MSQLILTYLLNKMRTPISDITQKIDKKILEIVKLKGKKEPKKSIDGINRQRVMDNLSKEAEELIKMLNVCQPQKKT